MPPIEPIGIETEKIDITGIGDAWRNLACGVGGNGWISTSDTDRYAIADDVRIADETYIISRNGREIEAALFRNGKEVSKMTRTMDNGRSLLGHIVDVAEELVTIAEEN